MKFIKRSLAVFLTVIMTVSSLPLTGSFVSLAADEKAPVFLKAQQEQNPIVPEGYYLTGKTNFDEDGNTIWQTFENQSEGELIHEMWIDVCGNEVPNPDKPLAYPEKNKSTERTRNRGESLPESYDARDYNLVMPVENQIGGTCWAHAAAACLEGNYIKQGYGKSVDISEYHIAWYSTNGYYSTNTYSANDGFVATKNINVLNNGGNSEIAQFSLANFAGAALESKFPFSSTTDTDLANEMPTKFTYAKKYTHDVVLDSVKSLGTYNTNTIKQAILDYGAADISYYSDDKFYNTVDIFNADNSKPVAFYNPYIASTNHEVTVVGWDDNFSRTNFNTLARPSKNGAWLCKNSWGTDWGNDGYFWISYEDISIQVDPLYVYIAADSSDFEDVYMYDGVGYTIPAKEQASANIFTAKNNIYLTKISYGSTRAMDYTLKVYTGLASGATDPTKGTLIYTQSGNTRGEKYIPINGDVNISKGQRYSVVLECDTHYFEGNEYSTFGLTAKFNASKGESFVKSGGKWYDSTECYVDSSNKCNNSCIRVIAKKQADSAPYKVTFNDPGYCSIVTRTNTGKIALPQKSGHTYVLTYNGKAFNSTTVSRDMTVEMHCYPTNGKPISSSGCSAEYKCIYCGKAMKPSIENHDYKTVTTAATKTSIGHTEKTCSLCGDVAVSKYVYYSGSKNGEASYSEGSLRWQYVDGNLVVDCTGKIPDYASSVDMPWNNYKSQVTALYVTGKPTYLGRFMLCDLVKMKTLSLPSTVTGIGPYCFAKASSLTEFTCPANLTTIADHAFNEASSLKTVNYNKKIKTIQSYAFQGCKAMTQATIPGTVTTLGDFIYQDCSALKKIIISEGVTFVPSLTWNNNVLEEVVIPSTVVNGNFYNYVHLDKYTVSASNTAYCSVDGVLYNKAKTTLVSYPSTKPGEYYKIPSTVKTISSHCFMLTANLKYLDMSECKVTGIDYKTFDQCYALANINLPATLTAIGTKGFHRTSMPQLYVPSTVTSLAIDAFDLDVSSSVYCIPHFYTDTSQSAIYAYALVNRNDCTVSHALHNFNKPLTKIGEKLCTEGGQLLNGCECGNFEYKTVGPQGHLYTAKTVSSAALKSAATCSCAAVYYYSCAYCGKVENNSSHTFTSGSAAGHSYKWTPIKKATFTSPGLKQGVCSRCGDISDTQVIPAVTSISLSTTKYVYSGTNKTPKVTIKDSTGKTLVKNTDYTLTVASKRSGIGRYIVKITLKGNYEGKKNTYFYILPGKPTAKAASQSTNSVTLSWNAVAGAAGYTVYRYSATRGAYVKVGSTTSTSYTVKSLYSGTKYTFRVYAYGKTSAGKIYYSNGYSLVKTATKTKTPTLSSVTSSSRGTAKLKWSSVTGETGYTVYYSTSSNSGFKKYANFAANSTGGTATNLTSGRAYYFKVRTYIKTDSGYVYSAWSSVKSVLVR